MNATQSIRVGVTLTLFHRTMDDTGKVIILEGPFTVTHIAAAVSGPGYYGTVEDAHGNVAHGYMYLTDVEAAP